MQPALTFSVYKVYASCCQCIHSEFVWLLEKMWKMWYRDSSTEVSIKMWNLCDWGWTQFIPENNLNIHNEIKEKNKLLTQQNRRNRGLHGDATHIYQTWTVASLGRYQLTSYTQAEWLVRLLAGGGKRRAHRNWRGASVQASGLQRAKTATNQPTCIPQIWKQSHPGGRARSAWTCTGAWTAVPVCLHDRFITQWLYLSAVITVPVYMKSAWSLLRHSWWCHRGWSVRGFIFSKHLFPLKNALTVNTVNTVNTALKEKLCCCSKLFSFVIQLMQNGSFFI